MLLALAPTLVVRAMGELRCPSDFEASRLQGNESIALTIAKQLEAAWNAGNRVGALALFADNVVAADSSGLRWEGKQELVNFLDRMWDPNYSPGILRVESVRWCAVGEQVLWQFVYPDTGATGSANMVVTQGLITQIFWSFVPGIRSVASTSPEPTTPLASSKLAAAVSCICAFAAIGCRLWRRRSPADPSTRPQGQLLRALPEARSDRGSRESY
jgi:hypothetical protein